MIPSHPDDLLTCLQARWGEDWLVAEDSQQFWQEVDRRRDQLQSTVKMGSNLVLLSERDPLLFLASVMAAGHLQCPVALGNAQWSFAEWQQVGQLLSPTWVWGEVPQLTPNPSPVPLPSGAILIPTGGSSGRVRFAVHTWQTLLASVQGFWQYFGGDRLHSCCVLPLYHVSGFMQFMRSFTSGGRLALYSYKALEAGQCPSLEPQDFFLSLVPTQLHRLLSQPQLIPWLQRFRAILLGGAPAWADLLYQSRNHRLPLAPTYGMTETASQIATLKPDDFLAGQTSAGLPLPHAQVSILNADGNPVLRGQPGRVAVQSASLCLGYVASPALEGTLVQPPSPFLTDDMGRLDDQGYLHILGRQSHKIITGGENVFPEEIEAAMRTHCSIQDVCVLGMPDDQWGEAVTAVYVPQHESVTVEELRRSLQGHLSRFKLPKRWISMEHLPRNAQGKVNREALRQAIMPQRTTGG